MIVNNYSPDVLDRNAFIDPKTRKMFLLSDKDIQSGFIPTAILYATIIPSAFCLITQPLVHKAIDNQSCGYLKFSTLERTVGDSKVPWKFIPTPAIALSDSQKLYALAHGITHEQMAILLGHPLDKYQPVNKLRAKTLELFNEDIWLKHKDNALSNNSSILDKFADMSDFCKMLFGDEWERAEMDGVDSFIGMVYNLKFRPFDALDQQSYIYLMLKGLSHNVASIVSEVTYACIEDTAIRLIYRNRINNILYRNRTSLRREIGSEGKQISSKVSFFLFFENRFD